MSLNSHKTKYMYITRRQQWQNINTSLPPLHIENGKKNEVAAHQVQEAITHSDLSWTNHVLELTKSISHKLYQLSKIKHFLNAHARKQFFPAYSQSIIDYSSTLWDSASANTQKPLSIYIHEPLILILPKPTTLTAHDCKSLDTLPLKSKLEHNKGW